MLMQELQAAQAKIAAMEKDFEVAKGRVTTARRVSWLMSAAYQHICCLTVSACFCPDHIVIMTPYSGC